VLGFIFAEFEFKQYDNLGMVEAVLFQCHKWKAFYYDAKPDLSQIQV